MVGIQGPTMTSQQLHNIVTPHEHDVLSGRGNFVNYHAGNEHFRALVRKHKVAYVACPKQQKAKFSRMIVEEIRRRNPPGRFLKQDPNTKLWNDIGEKKALDKTRQALREGAPEIMKELSGDGEGSDGEGVDVGNSHENSTDSPVAPRKSALKEQLLDNDSDPITPHPAMGRSKLAAAAAHPGSHYINRPINTPPRASGQFDDYGNPLEDRAQMVAPEVRSSSNVNVNKDMGPPLVNAPQVYSITQQQQNIGKGDLTSSDFGQNDPMRGLAGIRQAMQQQQLQQQLQLQQRGLPAPGSAAGIALQTDNLDFGGMSELDALSARLGGMSQMQQMMYGADTFEPRPLAPSVNQKVAQRPRPLDHSPGAQHELDDTVGPIPQRRKQQNMERSASDRSLKMDGVFQDEGTATGRDKMNSSGLSIMSISIGDIAHGRGGGEDPSKNMSSNTDDLSQLFDSSLRLKRAVPHRSISGESSMAGQNSDITKVMDMSMNTLGESFVKEGSLAPFSESQMSFSNVFDESDRDNLHVGG